MVEALWLRSQTIIHERAALAIARADAEMPAWASKDPERRAAERRRLANLAAGERTYLAMVTLSAAEGLEEPADVLRMIKVSAAEQVLLGMWVEEEVARKVAGPV